MQDETKTILSDLRTKLADVRNSCIEQAQLVKSLAGKVPFDIKSATLSLVIQYLDAILHDKGAEEMIKASDVLSIKTVRLEDIKQHQRKSALEDKILEEAEKLKPGDAVQIDHTKIKYGHFAGKVNALKEDGKLPKKVVVMKAGEEFFLAKAKD